MVVVKYKGCKIVIKEHSYLFWCAAAAISFLCIHVGIEKTCFWVIDLIAIRIFFYWGSLLSSVAEKASEDNRRKNAAK